MHHAELTLDEMLADEIVHLVMRRDGVVETEIRDLMARLRRHSSPVDPLAHAA